MILIQLGTTKFQFTRPLSEIENLCEQGIINDKIIVQSGFTKYQSKHFEIIPLIETDKLNELIDKSTLVISHAGTGSVLGAIKKNKKTIAVARYQELGEHIDNHQLDLLDEFSKKGYLIPWYKEDNLIDILSKVKTFTPKPYISSKQKIIEYLKNYISDI